jgi:hypothetical protein
VASATVPMTRFRDGTCKVDCERLLANSICGPGAVVAKSDKLRLSQPRRALDVGLFIAPVTSACAPHRSAFDSRAFV